MASSTKTTNSNRIRSFSYLSVEGFSLNYLVMNISGYAFYGIYTTLGYFYHEEGAGTVVIADLVFVYHAIAMVIIQTIQVIIYPRGSNRVSSKTIALCIGLWTIILAEVFFTKIVEVFPESKLWNPVSVLGYGKITLSFIKYSPAVYWNYKRKSTKGWSIFNILLDLVGATFSAASGSLSVSDGLNITKMALAVLTIFYDIIFVVQHYILYRKSGKKKTEGSEVLLGRDAEI